MKHNSLLQENEDQELFIRAILAGAGEATALFFAGIKPALEKGSLAIVIAGDRGEPLVTVLYHLNELKRLGCVHQETGRVWKLSPLPDAVLNISNQELFTDTLMSNMGLKAALFLCAIADDLYSEDHSALELAQKFNISNCTAISYLNRLSIKQYVERLGYRKWGAGERLLELYREKVQS